MPSPAAATYYPEEVAFYAEGAGTPFHEYLDDHDTKEAKEKKKKKKKKSKESKRSSFKESRRSSFESASSKWTLGSSVSLEMRGLEPSEPRDHTLETKEERRKRHERRKKEELENPELKRERRERRKQSTIHRRSSDRGGMPREVDHLLGEHSIPTELCLISDMITEQPPGPPLVQEHWGAAHRRVPKTDVPRTIEVIMDSSSLLDSEPDIPYQQNRKSSKSDYDRLMRLLEEQNETPALHPLIAASDHDFQEAFDTLARDSVFDDNFEKAFNEFSEHYLVLSPLGEDDSIKDKCDKDYKSSKNQPPYGEEDFIQIPLTPVSRRGLTGYISKDFNHKSASKKEITNESDFEDITRKPIVQKGVLSSKSLERISEKKRIEVEDEFFEILRTPFSHGSETESPEQQDDADSKDKDSAPSSLPNDKSRKWKFLRRRRSATSV
jgi:hypothetical protein